MENKTQEDKKRAVIYARFSSSNQREESITAQIRACKIYASNVNIEIVGIYSDKAISGKTAERPDFLKMIEASKHGNFDIVLCDNKTGKKYVLETEYTVREDVNEYFLCAPN